MMAMTTSNSMSVNAFGVDAFRMFILFTPLPGPATHSAPGGEPYLLYSGPINL